MEIRELFAKIDYYVGILAYVILATLWTLIPLFVLFSIGDIWYMIMGYIISLLMYYFFEWFFKYYKRFLIWKAKKLYHIDLETLKKYGDEEK